MSGVSYFIQSHRDPEQIYRLVRRVRAGSRNGRIIVQHNFASCALDWSPLASLPDTHLLRAKGTQVRSNYSCQVQPYLEAIDWLEQERLPYEWLVNLSAQDYPVKPIVSIEAELLGSKHDGFIRYWDVLSAESPWSRRKARDRYWYQYRRWPAASKPLLRALRPFTRVLPLNFHLVHFPQVGMLAFRPPFRDGFRCYGGWAWFALRRHTALYLREFLRTHPEIERHYRRTITPEESLIQTLLVNSGRFDLQNDDLRYIDYSTPYTRQFGGSPRVLTVADLPLLATGRYHFARKFDYGVDRVVLDRIDHDLLGVDPGSA